MSKNFLILFAYKCDYDLSTKFQGIKPINSETTG